MPHSDDEQIAVIQPEAEFPSSVSSNSTELTSEYRRRRRHNTEKSISTAQISAEESQGWVLQRRGKITSRMKRAKNHEQSLEDRAWCLAYSMGYQKLNLSRIGIRIKRGDHAQGIKQINVYAEDDETILIIECKSRDERGRKSLGKEIQETAAIQNYIRSAIRHNESQRKKLIFAYFTSNIIWSPSDVERSEAAGIKIVTENEFNYFDVFIKHIGPAGRYQILGEFLRGQKIPELEHVRVPAIRGKIGGEIFFSFVTTPRNLLKISFINHQAFNHPDGQPAYQRMISDSRIREIGSFISKGGFFPTNILLNFSDDPRFDLISNNENSDRNVKFGWLTLPSKYKSALVIDGQHRLYGFSRLSDHFLDQSLFVLAFSKMTTYKEADLFITINHKQKSVPNSLLVSLLADLRMGDSDPATALSALASAIVRKCNNDKTSPLFRRFGSHGVPPEATQNLTISEFVNGLRRSGLVGRVTGKNLIPGPMSAATDDLTIRRSTSIFNAYFEALRTAHPQRWNAGREAYISTNPGIRAHLIIISSVVSYLSNSKSIDFFTIDETKFADLIIKFCDKLFTEISSATDEYIKSQFSRKFGEGGVTEYAFNLMRILQKAHPDFGSEEFQRWVEQSKSEKIDEVNQFLMKLAERLTDFVIDTLKKIHGIHRLASDEPAYWELGVESERIRKNAYEAQQSDRSRRKPKEAYLNIVDLAEIVKQSNNWDHFSHVFSNPRAGERSGQKYYLGWINAFNELRNIAAHKNQLKTYTDDDLEFVDWLRATVSPKVPS